MTVVILASNKPSDVPAPEGPAVSLPACLDSHLQWLRQRGLSEGTIYARRRAVTRLAAYFHLRRDCPGAPCRLTEATQEQLAAWHAWTAARVGDDALYSYTSHVHQFYNWAVATGHAVTNPAAGLPYPRLGRRLPRPIADDPLMYALQCAPPRIRPWLVLAGWAGLRAKEIALLTRRNVLDTANPPVLLIAGDATKGRNERIVPMSDFVLAELRAYGLPTSGWVFPRGDGERGPNKPWTISGLANKYLHSLGINETLHQLRHRFGTATYAAALDIRVTQELLGHASPATTAGYAAFSNVTAQAAVQKLPVPPRRLRAVSGGPA